MLLIWVPEISPSKSVYCAGAVLVLTRRTLPINGADVPAGTKILEPNDAYHAVRHYADRRQERFICLSLNGAHEIIAARIVTMGLIDKTIVHPREVFSDPISDRASAVIVAHNHPSGQMIPSEEDDEITLRLQKAAKILGINFLDHLIFSEDSYISYRKSGRVRF